MCVRQSGRSAFCPFCFAQQQRNWHMCACAHVFDDDYVVKRDARCCVKRVLGEVSQVLRVVGGCVGVVWVAKS